MSNFGLCSIMLTTNELDLYEKNWSTDMQTIRFSLKDNIYIPRIEDVNQMESSLFKQVYNNAKKAIVETVRNCEPYTADASKQSKYLNKWLGMSSNTVIAFMGERGSGKTSAMLTVANALDSGEWISEAEFEVLPPVEPSHLSERETVLDVVVSKLYNQFNEMVNPKGGRALEADQQRIVLEKFVDVHDAIRAYNRSKEERLPMDSGVESLSFLASGNDLSKKLYNLIVAFLDSFKKVNKTESNSKQPHFLVLCIDDLDLNLRYGYELCEEIRKFFSLPNVIVLFSCKLQQLSDSIKQRYISDMQMLLNRTEDQPSDSVEGMAVKYLDKLVPVTHRCYMPLFNVQTMREVKIEDEKGNEVYYVDTILNLLFQKAGVVLIKNRFGSHHFIPNQLREMVHLYAFLLKMRDVDLFKKFNAKDDNAKDDKGKVILNRQLSDETKLNLTHNLSMLEDHIREHVKVQSIEHRYRKIILETMEINWEELNQRVCRMVKDFGLVTISSTDGSEDICNTKTIPENVSIGDALYLLNQVSEEKSTFDAKCFKAFMKILYSITLVRQLFLSNKGDKNLRQLLGGLIYNPQGNAIVRAKRDFQPNVGLDKFYTNALPIEKHWLQLHVVSWGLTNSKKKDNHWLRSDMRVPYLWNGFKNPKSSNYDYFSLSYLASLTNVLLYDSSIGNDKAFGYIDNALIDYVQHYLSPVLLFSADYIDALPSKVHFELEQNILKSKTNGSAYYTAMVAAIKNVTRDLVDRMPWGNNNQLAEWFRDCSSFPLWNEKYYQNINGIWDGEGEGVSEYAVYQLEEKLDAIRECRSKQELKDILNLRSFPRKIVSGEGLPDAIKKSIGAIQRKTNNDSSNFEELRNAAAECIQNYLSELKAS